MSIFEALFLGLVQGVTEFLPVSSSGHLALTHAFIGSFPSAFTFDVFLHFCTLLAVGIFFRKKLIALTIPDLWYLGVASIPAVVFGLLFRSFLSTAAASLPLVLVLLAGTGCINLLTASLLRKKALQQVEPEALSTKKALFVGFFQAFALLPGISRSGSTVLGAVAANMSRKEAFEFSFIMSIPVIAGGTLLELFLAYRSGELGSIEVIPFAVGGAAAFIAGLLSLRLLKIVIEKAKLDWFGWYCITVAVGVFLATSI